MGGTRRTKEQAWTCEEGDGTRRRRGGQAGGAGEAMIDDDDGL